MTQPGIELQSSGLLMKALTIMPIYAISFFDQKSKENF